MIFILFYNCCPVKLMGDLPKAKIGGAFRVAKGASGLNDKNRFWQSSRFSVKERVVVAIEHLTGEGHKDAEEEIKRWRD